MMLSSDLLQRILSAICDAPEANELASAVNNGNELSKQSSWSIPAAIVATAVSTTTDFGALKVGDKLIHIPAAAGNSAFETIATAGTKPSAAVIGDLYIALRSYSRPAATTAKN